MKEKTKNKVYIPNLILLIIIGLTVAFISFNIINLSLSKKEKVPVLNTLENEYYVVGKKPTAFQKEVFKQLTEELEEKNRNYNKISELVAKSFVIDFFGWSNKDASFDIGGLQYTKDPETFSKVTQWEYYQKLDVFKKTYGSSGLPEVKSINQATTRKISDYEIEDKKYPAYEVYLQWSYNDVSNSSIKEFPKEAKFTLVNDDGKISIVEVTMLKEVNEDE